MSRTRGIPQSIVNEIKTRSDIVAVIEQYVRLSKRSAANLFGLCPFHAEKTPSFSVSPEKQMYYCFGCHKGGDVIHFIMDIEKVGYLEALRLLADRAGVQIPAPDDPSFRQRAEREALLYKINTAAAAHFYLNLMESPQGRRARDYLIKRGITTGSIRKFGLGYATDDWENLWRRLRDKGFATDALAASGLFRQGREGPYDLFRNRIIFPIFDALGRVIAFGGRVMDDSQPKYINSPENAIYTKGRHLYALNFAKKSKEPDLIIVEGYMDAIAMHQAGVENTVAALGTALTANQAQLARRYTEQVVIGFDADPSGQDAARRSLDVLVAKGCQVTVLLIPDGKDPDDYIRRNGPDRFRDLVRRAVPLMDYKLLVAERQATSQGDLDILAYQDEACRVLASEPNPIVRELYAAKVAEKLGVASETVMREVDRRRSRVDSSAASDSLRDQLARQQEKTDGKSPVPVPVDALFLLCILATQPDLTDGMRVAPQPDDFPLGVIRDLAAAVLDQETLAVGGVSALISMAGDGRWGDHRIADEIARLSFEVDVTAEPDELVEAANEYLARMRRERLLARKSEIVAAIAEDDATANKAELKEELLDIDVQLRQFRG